MGMHLRFRLFVFLIFVSITVRCVVGEENSDCSQAPPGSEETRLSTLEKRLRNINNPIDGIKFISKEISDVLGVHKKESTSKKTTLGNILNQYVDKGNVILPGTLWCGIGDIAKNKSGLGWFKGTDACCRAHGNCKIDITAGDTRFNLKNNGIFTRSSCSCDNAFYHCLKNVSSLISESVGKTYFNIFQLQCFECVYPENITTGDSADDKCTKYEWRDNPKY